MSAFEKLKIDEEDKSFLAKNLEKHSVYNNLEQIRAYMALLCQKISAYRSKFRFALARFYGLLVRYSAWQNPFREIRTENNSR